MNDREGSPFEDDPPHHAHQAPLHEHRALFYRNQDEYEEGLRRFFAPAIAAGEPVAAAVPKAKLPLLDRVLTDASDRTLLDMEEFGQNPGRLIPAVEKLLIKHRGKTLHFVGEPIWSGRSRAEICEAVRHEALTNSAWPGAQVRMLCPYDAEGLEEEVLRSAERTHPTVIQGGESRRSSIFSPVPPADCEQALDALPPGAGTLELGREQLGEVRALAARHAADAGLTPERADDFVIVANELASNAILHGEPPRRIAIWKATGKVICEVTNRGRIADRLAGRRYPTPEGDHGMGLWIVHQLCQLVEVRSGKQTTVRAHFAAA